MKKLSVLLFCVMPFLGFAQAVTADPALDPMDITTQGNTNILFSQLPLGVIIKLKVPILNRNSSNALPAGSCKIKIGLGSKMILDPLFNLQTANTGNFFDWTATSSGGQVQITGELVAQLPASYSDTAYFDVKGIVSGSSTITTNFLVTNHNTPTLLSDENGANNVSSIFYTVVNTVVPITFANFNVQKELCYIRVSFNAENEVNVQRFDIEMSNDGTHFEKVAGANAANLLHYLFRIDIPQRFQQEKLFIRVKATDISGENAYTAVKKTSGTCTEENGTALQLFPNPVPKNIYLLTITGKNLPIGSCNIVITDAAGKVYETGTVPVSSDAVLNYPLINNLPAGTYFMKIRQAVPGKTTVLKFIRL